ncbi:MAG: UspA protein [Geobacteraceae bacterium]|jgi:nucleotide-binding universal stress UspA family protein|nr:UspA protein [Geobacteraceae bacterium]
MFKPSRILVPTDMSEHSDKAVRHAFDIARFYNSEVFLLHVIQDPIQQCTIDYCISADMVTQFQQQMLESTRRGMRTQLAKFPSIDPKEITTDIKTGVPHEEILNEAEERKIDLIVLSSLGSTGISKYTMGSVARHVLRGAKCSVLLAK